MKLWRHGHFTFLFSALNQSLIALRHCCERKGELTGVKLTAGQQENDQLKRVSLQVCPTCLMQNCVSQLLSVEGITLSLIKSNIK